MYDLGRQFHLKKDQLIVDRKCTLIGEKYRIQILTERLIRLEYNENGHFVDSQTALVVKRKFPRPIFTVREDPAYLYIDTAFINLKYLKNSNFTEKSLDALITQSQKQWFYGQKEVYNYGGTTISLDNKLKLPSLSKGLYSPLSFVTIDDSNSLLLDEYSNVYKREENSKDIYIFAYGTDFSLVLQDYFNLTGYPSFIPRYALGNWWSRDIPYQNEHILPLLNKFRMSNIPISVFLFDQMWSKKDKAYQTESSFSFSEELIKEPKKLINTIHKMNIKVGVKINPVDGIFPYEDYYNEAKSYINPNKKGIIEFNYFDARFMDLYLKILIHPLLNLGIDLFWNDFKKLDNIDSLFILNDYMKKDLERSNIRSIVLSRNSLYAAHRYPICYSGKNQISWDVLKFLPMFNITSSNIGVCYWSHDVGGSTGGIEDGELYIRSVELAVFSPFLRFNTESGTYYKREPWRWDIVTNNIVSYYLRLRHQLIPYLYTEIYKYHKEGIPFIEPFYYKYPFVYDDPNYVNQYFFGSSLLISPIIKKTDSLINRTIQKFFIPEGTWYDFKSGKKYLGNKKYVSFYKIEDYPVFVKAGGIIPLAGVSDLMQTECPKELEINVFPGETNHYDLYEDDGISKDYLKDNFSITRIEYNYLNNNYTLIIRNISGKSNLLFEERNYKIKFRNTKTPTDIKVYSNSDVIPFTSYQLDTDFIVEIKNVKTNTQLTINCQGQDVEVDALLLINDDIDSILSDLKVPTKLKDKIALILYNKDIPINKKRIAIKKLKKYGLDKRSIKIFIRLIEYMSEM